MSGPPFFAGWRVQLRETREWCEVLRVGPTVTTLHALRPGVVSSRVISTPNASRDVVATRVCEPPPPPRSSGDFARVERFGRICLHADGLAAGDWSATLALNLLRVAAYVSEGGYAMDALEVWMDAWTEGQGPHRAHAAAIRARDEAERLEQRRLGEREWVLDRVRNHSWTEGEEADGRQLTVSELRLLGASRSWVEWHEACDEVKKHRNGAYPSGWGAEILVSGFAAHVFARLPQDG